MKEIKITVGRQKTELKIFCVCFVCAFILNIVSIIVYQTEWKELYSQLFWVLAFACLMYGLTIVGRVLFYLIKTLFKGRH